MTSDFYFGDNIISNGLRYQREDSCSGLIYFSSHNNIPSVIVSPFSSIESCIVYMVLVWTVKHVNFLLWVHQCLLCHSYVDSNATNIECNIILNNSVYIHQFFFGSWFIHKKMTWSSSHYNDLKYSWMILCCRGIYRLLWIFFRNPCLAKLVYTWNTITWYKFQFPFTLPHIRIHMIMAMRHHCKSSMCFLSV